MSAAVEYRSNLATAVQIAEHLLLCDADFIPPLSGRVDIRSYAAKIADKAMRFEAWADGVLVGLVAAYCNDREGGVAYITSVSVLKAWSGKGIAALMMESCIQHARASGLRQARLEVAQNNGPAIRLYEKIGFVADTAQAPFVVMNLNLKNGEEHEQPA